jgi:hypothetical protein
MRRILAMAAALVLVAGAVPLQAQLSTQRSWGLGVSLTGVGSSDGTPVDIRIPIRAGLRWRVEPEIGLLRSSQNYSAYYDGSPDTHQAQEIRELRLALSVSRVVPVDSTTRFYVGARFGLRRSSYEVDTDPGPATENYGYTLSDRQVGLLTGAEASIGSRMTIGAEVGLTRVFHGEADPDLPPSTYTTFLDGGHDLVTTGAIVVRWFRGKGNVTPAN